MKENFGILSDMDRESSQVEMAADMKEISKKEIKVGTVF